jgi:hypothetical protein
MKIDTNTAELHIFVKCLREQKTATLKLVRTSGSACSTEVMIRRINDFKVAEEMYDRFHALWVLSKELDVTAMMTTPPEPIAGAEREDFFRI